MNNTPLTFQVGSRVRSHDFGKDRGGRPPCYVEGTIESLISHPIHGGQMYKIKPTLRIFNGEKMGLDEFTREDGYCYVSMGHNYLEPIEPNFRVALGVNCRDNSIMYLSRLEDLTDVSSWRFEAENAQAGVSMTLAQAEERMAILRTQGFSQYDHFVMVRS